MQILVLAYVIDEITDRGAWVGLVAITQMVINVAIGVGTMIQGALYDWVGPRVTVSISAATIVVLASWLVSTRRFASMDVGTAAS